MRKLRIVITFFAVLSLVFAFQGIRVFANTGGGKKQHASTKFSSHEEQLIFALFQKSMAGNAKAFSSLKTKAANGNPIAEYALGSLYEQGGKGIPVNARKALLWIGRSARAGYLNAQGYYGMLYGTGKLGKKDYRKARHWLTIAAGRGLQSAQANLAWMYEKGWGGPVDIPGATHLYETAVAHGLYTAKPNLEDLADSEWGRHELVVGPVLVRLGMSKDKLTRRLPATWSLDPGRSGWFFVTDGSKDWSGALRFHSGKVDLTVSNLADANKALVQTYLHAAARKGGCQFEAGRRIGDSMAVTDFQCPNIAVLLSGKSRGHMPQCSMLAIGRGSKSLGPVLKPTLWKECGSTSK